MWLRKAVAACRLALKVRTRERVPLQWAITKANLANALRALGERENVTALLEAAASAHRAALEVRTSRNVPLQWAINQASLGNTLRELGEREHGAARLEEAEKERTGCRLRSTTVRRTR